MLNQFLMSESLSFPNALTVNCGEPCMQDLGMIPGLLKQKDPSPLK